VQLAAGSVERALATWRAWAAESPGDTLSIVQIAGHVFVRAPKDLARRFEPATMRGARLSYADASSLRVPQPEATVVVGLDDDRLARLEAATPHDEWWEAVTWPKDGRVHAVVAPDGELDAIAMVEDWYGIAGHIGVVTRPDRRGRGQGRVAAGAAALDALARGLLPQWRARIGNHASQRVADRLGFVTIGIQLFVRLPGVASTTMET